jgi:epoxide hydrolase-like predicted phosphatase
MTIRAVVFDIGGVLEITPEMDVSQQWEACLGLPDGEIGRRLADIWAGGTVGTVTERMAHQAIRDRLGLAREQAEAMMAEIWVQYLGGGNNELIEYVRHLRPRYRTGILSNSFVGAREREQEKYGFEDLVDEIVYSHEVGMSKPDPRIYELTWTRLGVRPEEMVFLDDVEPNVASAREAGIHAVHYRDNVQAIAEIEAALLAASAVDGRRATGTTTS